MRNKISNLILVVSLLIGIALLSYPTLSDYWNSFHQSKAIVSYEESMDQMNEVDYSQWLTGAKEYNDALAVGEEDMKFTNGEPVSEEYISMLNVNDNSIMGYIEIESIDVSLPIYHGTAESILSVGVGHLEGSSLPVGGESAHTILAGHRGLASAKLFTDLDKVQEGDIFTLHILREVFTYQVDDIVIVEPYEVDGLHIIEGEDLCTLVTCTPYGINSQRLLIQGRRIENVEAEKKLYIVTEAFRVEPVLVAPLVATPILIVLGIVLIFKPSKKEELDIESLKGMDTRE